MTKLFRRIILLMQRIVLMSDEFVNRIDGDRILAVKLIDTFLKNCEEILPQLKKSIDVNETEELKNSSHLFRGKLLYFSKKGAELTLKLEKMGQSGKIDMEKANSIYNNLVKIIDTIIPKLKEYKIKIEFKK